MHEGLQWSLPLACLFTPHTHPHTRMHTPAQGHLSRCLAFEHGLDVISVEAEGCHQDRAARFAQQVAHGMRKEACKALAVEQGSQLSENKGDYMQLKCGKLQHVTAVVCRVLRGQAQLCSLLMSGTVLGLNNCCICFTQGVSCMMYIYYIYICACVHRCVSVCV